MIQESSGLLSNLGIKIPLSWILLVGPFLFQRYKINEIVNNFLLVGDKYMPDIYLRQPGFTYSAYGKFTKNKERTKKFK